MAIQTDVDDKSSDLAPCSAGSQTLQVGDTTVEIRETEDGFEAVEVNPYSRRYRFFDPIVGAINKPFEYVLEAEPGEGPRLTYGQSGLARLLTGIPIILTALVITCVFCMLWAIFMSLSWLIVPRDELGHVGLDSEP